MGRQHIQHSDVIMSENASGVEFKINTKFMLRLTDSIISKPRPRVGGAIPTRQDLHTETCQAFLCLCSREIRRDRCTYHIFDSEDLCNHASVLDQSYFQER